MFFCTVKMHRDYSCLMLGFVTCIRLIGLVICIFSLSGKINYCEEVFFCTVKMHRDY